MVTPELTVVVATHNRRDRLRACLESLARQTEPAQSFEVVVVVDGSTDGTAEMLAALAPPFPLSIVSQPKSGTSAARNAGAAQARGEILLFIDDDEEAAPTLVGAHRRAHGSAEKLAGIGPIAIRLEPGADRFARILAEQWRKHTDRLASRELTYLDCYGGNCSVRRASFEEVGGFAPDLARENDFEFAYRLHRAGVSFRFVPDGGVTESRNQRWQDMVDELELRGRLAIDLYRRHPAMIEKMEIGGYGAPSGRRAAMRRAALRLGVPPRLLAQVALAMPRERWARSAFRFVWDYTYWRGVRAATDAQTWRSLRRGVLILLYHAFAADGEAPSRYVVPGRMFKRQMALLKWCRFNVISVDDYVAYRREYRFPPPRSVVITADDGYADNDTVARPILERFGFTATVFLITSPDRINPGATESPLAGRPLLDLGRAREIAGGALQFGAHTRTHPELPALDAGAVEAEVHGCRQELEQALGVQVRNFAYPFGEVDAAVQGVVEQSGFWSACGVRPGRNRPATDPYDLRRIEVRGTYSLRRFLTILLLGDTRRSGRRAG
jgi:glycosyltransferase involved in cell wall biosynthesis